MVHYLVGEGASNPITMTGDKFKGKGLIRVIRVGREIRHKIFFNFIYVNYFETFMPPLNTMQIHGFQSCTVWKIL